MNITEKIKTARKLYQMWAEELRSDPCILSRLNELGAALRASRLASVESGISDICRRCEEQDGGSCCGAGIEDRYTPELLLINLLLGSELPSSSKSSNSCHFLGERGCLLTAREIICINYLCARVREEIAGESLIRLQEITGREMEFLFVLHNLVRDRIRQAAK